MIDVAPGTMVVIAGTACHNPGIEMHWQGEQGRGFPVVTTYDPSIDGDLLVRAARPAA